MTIHCETDLQPHPVVACSLVPLVRCSSCIYLTPRVALFPVDSKGFAKVVSQKPPIVSLHGRVVLLGNPEKGGSPVGSPLKP